MIRLVKDFSEKQLEWRNNPEVYKTCRQNEAVEMGHHDSWVRSTKSDEGCRYWGIEVDEGLRIAGLKRKPIIVGYCGLSNIPTGEKRAHRNCEYSMLIGPEYQGKGYAKRALQLLLVKAFDELGMHLVWGEILDNNPAGIKIAEDLGFTREATLRQRYWKGRWVDSIIVSITEEEYAKHK